MSTFFGGDQLSDVVSVQGTTATPGQVIYTVPSGKYSQIFINRALTTLDVDFTNGSVSNRELMEGDEIILFAGDAIEHSIGSQEYALLVKVFDQP